MRYTYYLVVLVTTLSFSQELTIERANGLAGLPLKCLQQEYPNKLSQLLADSTEIAGPKVLHPAFYGCFDWHSSVHGHWSLVYLLKQFPNLDRKEEVISKLIINLSKENIAQEIAYLSKKHEKSFERTYGWAWLLKLQQELDTYNEPFAKKIADNLRPLSNIIAERYIEFLPKLNYPLRVGTHTNTAFGMSFAWDYAIHTKNVPLQNSIRENALRLFKNDVDCPFIWEPSGTDFLSPCMEEAGIMQRILPEKEFLKWLKDFAPPLFNKNYDWEPGKVSDRSDGHLVHLDGLNFSRAWNFYRLANQYPKQLGHLKALANKHLMHSLPAIVDGDYAGEHWLASFALYAFEEKGK
ncbi:DUF2891 domain-containing protein [Flavobacterium salilacus subsp. salilacus]|uniref:DUF2891 domain-containing protein n=1 Tax=Flavobacterium TaxID=237 RepID=UPI001074A2AA|nr:MULTISPECIES: DUF2891 domain-containing protein [Flavobacterium]KAF2519745.1 DUF2891 domain-containing protein [Flavobacterium salilacus subsp. salilacus]MBE1614365.1 DUF2891 domain-containing protein [Flavobacterium sp. SaA2.13]